MNVSFLFNSVLQPEPTLPERHQLARAVIFWYCSTKLELTATQNDEISASLGALIIEVLSGGESQETFPSLVNVSTSERRNKDKGSYSLY